MRAGNSMFEYSHRNNIFPTSSHVKLPGVNNSSVELFFLNLSRAAIMPVVKHVVFYTHHIYPLIKHRSTGNFYYYA